MGMLNLLQKLSSLGLEKIEALTGKSGNGFVDNISGLCTTLLKLKGEAASVAIAEEILEEYHNAELDDKKAFFLFLYNDLAADPDKVKAATDNYLQDSSQSAIQILATACEAPRLELLRTLNTAPGGTMALISMREDLSTFLKEDAAFKLIDKEMLSLFQSWFNRGFLQLRCIDWDTPARILEKLIQYESVHEIKGWPDLRRRLAKDRGCFGFFHPAIPDVPLIFVEAAMTSGISDNVSELLQQDVPSHDSPTADTAVFYSINNCLQGLRGVSFGNFLIKQVIEKLTTERSQLKDFATLSPVPGFMRWLHNADISELLTGEDAEYIRSLLASPQTAEQLSKHNELKTLLSKLLAHYLVNEKSRGQPADPVARFHLGNGARLERINWLADASPNGMQQAAGFMVNYLYDRKHLARNHEAYQQRAEISCSSTIRKLAASL